MMTMMMIIIVVIIITTYPILPMGQTRRCHCDHIHNNYHQMKTKIRYISVQFTSYQAL